MPLFDLAPKDSPKSLYGREAELDQIVRLVNAGRWTVLLGPRMMGKTSLALAALHRAGRPGVYVNLWGARGAPGLLNAFVQGLNANRTLLARVRRALQRVDGVSVGAAGITLAARTHPMRTLWDFVGLIAEESERAIVILDEVQELASISGPLLKMLANIFATHPKVVFVFTGSYFGLLRMLLEPPSHSPLFGRSPAHLRLDPFPRETSVSFLEAGLKEYGIRPPRERLEALVDRSLDGVPGWLALYGSHVAVQRLSSEAAERLTVREGKKVVRNELAHFLESRQPAPYWTTLRALMPEATWTELRNALSARQGAAVNDNSVRRILRSLLDANLIVEREHRYSIGDPMVRAYVRDTTSPPRPT